MARKKQKSSEAETKVISRRDLMKGVLVGLGAATLIQPNGGVQGAEFQEKGKEKEKAKGGKKKGGEEPKKQAPEKKGGKKKGGEEPKK